MQIFKFLILLILVSSGYSQNKSIKPSCQTLETSNDSTGDEVTKTCIYKNYKFVSVGSPDYSGRFFYEYFIYKIENKRDIQIKNSDFFLNIKGIEKLLNKNFKRKIASAKKIEEDSECMKFAKFQEYKIDDIGISFNENDEMEFNISLSLPNACHSLTFVDVSLDLNIIEKYLK